MLIPISYPLNRQSPLYPGTPPITITPHTSIAEGDPETTSIISLHGHSGTHIDLPKHFCAGGGSVADLLAPESVFEPAYCIEVPMEGEVPLRAADLAPHLPAVRDAKALLVRTGMSRFRDVDPEVYGSAHPWVHPDLPELSPAGVPIPPPFWDRHRLDRLDRIRHRGGSSTPPLPLRLTADLRHGGCRSLVREAHRESLDPAPLPDALRRPRRCPGHRSRRDSRAMKKS